MTRAPATDLRNIWASATGHFLNDLYGNIYPVLVPLVMDPLHLSVLLSAWVITSQTLTSSILQPLWGYISDRSQGIGMVPYALLVGSVVVALVGLSPSYPVLIGLVVVGGIANAAFHPAAAALVHRSSRAHRGRDMSIFMVAGNIGRALGPTVAGVAALLAAARSIGLIAIPGVLIAFWVIVRLRDLRRPAQTPEVVVGSAPIMDEAVVSETRSEGLATLLATLWKRSLPAALILVMSASRSVVTTAIVTFLPLRTHEAGGSVFVSALSIGVLLGAGSVGNALGGTLSDRFPRTWVVAISSAAAAIFMVLFVPATGLLAVVLLAVTGFAANSVSSVVMVMGQELFPDQVATASGMVLGWGNAVAALGTGVLALVADRSGINAALEVAAVVSFVGAPLALLYPAMHRRYGQGDTL